MGHEGRHNLAVLDLDQGRFTEAESQWRSALTDEPAFVAAHLGLEELISSYDMSKTPDGQGYYAFHKAAGMMIELIPYEKLIRDAERRNAAFFRQLNLS